MVKITHEKKSTIKHMFLIAAAGGCILALLFLADLYDVDVSHVHVANAADLHDCRYLPTDELRQASDDLTGLVRTDLVTPETNDQREYQRDHQYKTRIMRPQDECLVLLDQTSEASVANLLAPNAAVAAARAGEQESTREHSSGIAQANRAVSHLDRVTQQKAALFNGLAAAADSLIVNRG